MHYVPSSGDDAESVLRFLAAHPTEAEGIAHRGFELVRDLITVENMECYWRRLLRRYAKLQRFDIVLDETLVERTKSMLEEP